MTVPVLCRAYRQRPTSTSFIVSRRMGLANSPVRPAEGRISKQRTSVTRKGCGSVEQEHNAKQRDRPKLRDRLWGWTRLWGSDLLMVLGAGCVSAGVGWICPPAGLIVAGVLLIAGGVLWARGGVGP